MCTCTTCGGEALLAGQLQSACLQGVEKQHGYQAVLQVKVNGREVSWESSVMATLSSV